MKKDCPLSLFKTGRNSQQENDSDNHFTQAPASVEFAAEYQSLVCSWDGRSALIPIGSATLPRRLHGCLGGEMLREQTDYIGTRSRRCPFFSFLNVDRVVKEFARYEIPSREGEAL